MLKDLGFAVDGSYIGNGDTITCYRCNENNILESQEFNNQKKQTNKTLIQKKE